MVGEAASRGGEIADPQAFRAAVIIPARDAALTIGRAVRCALAEPEAAEVIVVDDGSSDGTLEAARAKDDGSGRLKLLRREQSGGPSVARNLAIQTAASPFVALLDADDFWLPGRLARLAALADGHEVVADDPLMLDGDAPGRAMPLIGADEPFELTLCDFLLNNISRRGRYRREWGYLKPVFRKSFLSEHALAYDAHVRLGEDVLLYATALARGARFVIAPPCGYVAVRRRGSLSDSHTGEDLEALLNAATRLKPELRAPADRAALSAYLRRLRGKTRYRQLLDARRAGGLPAVVSLILSEPDVLPAAVIGRLDEVQAPA